MGCICCPLGNFISSMLYAIERISTCAACAALVCCMLFTIVVACVFGVALGYHFCVVEHNADAMDRATMGDLSAGASELTRRRAAADAALSASDKASSENILNSDVLGDQISETIDRRRSAPQSNVAVKTSSANMTENIHRIDPRRPFGKVDRAIVEHGPARGLVYKRSIMDSMAFHNDSLSRMMAT